MKEIMLTRGKVALIDDEDAEKVIAAGPWYPLLTRSQEYAQSGNIGRHQYMHRFIIGAGKNVEVHHKNGNGLDNRRENLQPCDSHKDHLLKHHQHPTGMQTKQIPPLSVRISPKLRDLIREWAARAHIPVNRYVVNAIRAQIQYDMQVHEIAREKRRIDKLMRKEEKIAG